MYNILSYITCMNLKIPSLFFTDNFLIQHAVEHKGLIGEYFVTPLDNTNQYMLLYDNEMETECICIYEDEKSLNTISNLLNRIIYK